MRTDKKRKIFEFTDLDKTTQLIAVINVRDHIENYISTDDEIVKILTNDLYEFNPDGSIYFELN
jgi:hypothetical protein